MISKHLNRLVLAVTIATTLLFSPMAVAETWRITSLDWQPYSGSDLEDQGRSIAKLRNILARNNIELIVEFYPWKRAQKLADTRGYVGYFPAWPEEVTKGFLPSLPVDWSTVGVMTYTESSLAWESIDRLYQKNKVITIKTYVYPLEIENAMKRFPGNVITSPDEALCAKMLGKKRAKAAITDPNVMLYNAKKEGIKNIEILKNNLQKKALVIAFRDDDTNRRRVEFLNKILTED
jgi:polar amino acid transport system substrate-binding protein